MDYIATVVDSKFENLRQNAETNERKMIFSKPSDLLLRVVQLKSEFQIAVAEIGKIRSTEKEMMEFFWTNLPVSCENIQQLQKNAGLEVKPKSVELETFEAFFVRDSPALSSGRSSAPEATST